MMPDPVSSGKCTIGFIALAAEAAYRVKKDNKIDPHSSPVYKETLSRITDNGYAVTRAIAPKSSKGTGTTPLAALCLEPESPLSPIIISFRGTKAAGDIVSDIRIGIRGVVEEKFRNAAFDYYLDVRKQHPGREIIITGHSLGGFLAQYVATKAYNLNFESPSEPLLQVRTFNTAPIKTSHSRVFQRNPEVERQFVNYRLSPDLVSELPLQKYYGNTLVFPSNRSTIASHSMKSMVKELPEVIKQQSVGYDADTNNLASQCALIELTQGALYSYQSRIEGQIFSRFRAGASNLAKLQEYLPEIIKLMEKKDYDNALIQLNYLKSSLRGDVGPKLMDKLMKVTSDVKLEHLTLVHDIASEEKPSNASMNGRQAQLDIKSAIQHLRKQTMSAEASFAVTSLPGSAEEPDEPENNMFNSK